MKFVVIDGLDGAGKSTQADLLYNQFKNQGLNVILRNHPSQNTTYGVKSKNALIKTGKINHLKATIFYGLDVLYSLNNYYNADDIDILIFSRYTLAVVYLPSIMNSIIYKIVTIILPVSNYMFFLDVSPRESLKRLEERGEVEEMFENKDALLKARKKSLKITSTWNIIDADKDIIEVNKEIIEIINNS